MTDAIRFSRPGPLAIRPSAMFEVFASSVMPRMNTEAANGAVQIVSVTGPLAQEPDPCFDDYGAIRERISLALESTARAVGSPTQAIFQPPAHSRDCWSSGTDNRCGR